MAKQGNQGAGNRLKGNKYSDEISLKALQEKLQIQREINDALGYENSIKKNVSNLEIDQIENSRKLRDLEFELNKALTFKNQHSQKTISKLKDQILKQKQVEKVLAKQAKILQKQTENYNAINSAISQWANANFGFGAAAGFMMESDKAVRSLVLELGLSGKNSELLRGNMQGAATYAQNLGASMADLAKIQLEFSNETQRTASLTQEQFKSVTNIGKGTALGVDQAGQLVGQFNLLGISIQESEKFVQGVVDSSERLGINATRVLKTIGKNFKVLNTFSFKDGVKGMAKMAEYAEMYKADINDSINSAKMARSLEGSIEMASQLNVLGGEFAKQNPFELLFLSRNDPAAYTKKLAEMTKGMVTLQKNSEGKMQLGISPQDQDRMRLAAEALGTTYENMAESALRLKKMQMAKQDILGLGSIDDKDKEMIASLSDIGENGKMQVMLKGHAKEVSKLTTNDIDLLKQQQITLQARAKDSQTFEEVLKNTMLEMKTALLPVLNLLNDGLKQFNSIKDAIGEDWVKRLGLAAVALTIASRTLGISLNPLKSLKGLFGGGASVGTALSGAGAGAAGIAALGAAALGAGAGIALAAMGIAKLAESIKELSGTQILGLAGVVLAIGGAISLVLVPAIGALGAAGTAGAIGLAVIGLAAAGIGVALWGVGEAAKGIGQGFKLAADGVGGLFDKFAAIPVSQLFAIAGGIYAIGGAMAALGAGGVVSLIGGGGALAMLLAISSQANNLVKVGGAFKEIGVVLNSSADQIERVEKAIMNISNAKMESDSIVSKLSDIFSKPLKVEFSDKKVAISTDITLQIDGQKLAKVTDVGREAIIQAMRQKQGTGSSKRL